MMRKILSLFAIASMLVATSCSNEEFDSVKNGTEANVSFTAQLPEGLQTKMTRAYGDGMTAKNLTYAVYDEDWTLLEDLGGEKTFNLQTTVNLTLVNGKTYNIVFWADSDTEAISFDKEKAKVEVDYNKITANSEDLDAFFYVEKAYKVTGAEPKNVTLKRPFAQLNIGTADWEEAAKSVTISKTGVKVKGIYNTLDFKTGDVTGEKTSVTFTPGELPDNDGFPAGPEYKYLSMNYLLVSMDKSSDNEVTISYDGAVEERTFTSVPLQRNWRTNLYGNLITSQTEVNISIDEEFDDRINVPFPIAEVSSLEELTKVIDTGLTKVLLKSSIPIDNNTVIAPENELTIYTTGETMFNVASSVKLTLKNVILDGENKGNLSSDDIIVKGSIAEISDYGTRELYETPLIKCEGDLTLEDVKFNNYYGKSGSYGHEMINVDGTVESKSCVKIKNVEVSNNIGRLMVAANADITVENLMVQNNWLYGNKAGLIVINDNAEMTFKSGKIINNLMTVRSAGLFLAGGGKIIIEDGTFTNNYSGTNGSNSICSLFGVEVAGKLTVNDGTFEGNEGYRASVFSSRWCTATDAQIIINGGTYKNNSNRNTDFGESVDLFLRSNAMISKEATFTGDVVIDSGILENEGVISGDVTIKSGSLTGSGTVIGAVYSTETEK